MTDFKSRFIYPILAVRLLFFLALIGATLLFIVIGIPSLMRQHSTLKALGLIALGCTLFAYINFLYGRSILTQRYNLVIQEGHAFLRDIFVGKTINLDDNFKGFSLSSYGDQRRAFYDFKTLIFYFRTGQKIEFPQFLYSNFKDITQSLKNHSVKYLGQEPYKWKNLISRRYFFE